MPEDRKFKYSLFVLILFHLVGMVGIVSPYQSFFVLLTPFNLVLSATLLYLNHKPVSARLLYFLIFTFSLGFLVEGLGVNYGFMFGDYSYGRILGYQLWNVPVIISLNWTLIIYSVAILLDRFDFPVLVKIIAGSCLAVFLDGLMEPVAVRLDFWSWHEGDIPLQNYLGWFLTSIMMLAAYYLLKVKAKNNLALPFYFIQAAFFGSLQLLFRIHRWE